MIERAKRDLKIAVIGIPIVTVIFIILGYLPPKPKGSNKTKIDSVKIEELPITCDEKTKNDSIDIAQFDEK